MHKLACACLLPQGCIEGGVPFPDFERLLVELLAEGVDAAPSAANTIDLAELLGSADSDAAGGGGRGSRGVSNTRRDGRGNLSVSRSDGETEVPRLRRRLQQSPRPGKGKTAPSAEAAPEAAGPPDLTEGQPRTSKVPAVEVRLVKGSL